MNGSDIALPHSPASEQSLLGSMMMDQHALDRVRDIVAEADLYSADHRAIFHQVAAMIEAGAPVDVITVATALERAGSLDDVGGLAYLAALVQNTPSAANIRRYAADVAEHARLRALLAAAHGILDAVGNPTGRTAAEIAAEAERSLSGFVAADRGTDEPTTAADAMAAALRRLDDGAARRGIATGLEDFDHLTGGLTPGQLIVIAARPSVGKSALGLVAAARAASDGGRAVFFSLEMPREELALRLLAAETGIPMHALKAGPSESQWHALAAAVEKWSKRGLTLDERGAASLAYVRARCRRLNREGRLALIVADYLQLMTPENPRANRNEQVGSLSRGLKALAKELQVPVIALAQLNRGSEARADKRPMLSDLRDSGEVEQDADAVLLLHRASADGDVLECNLAKHRQGPTGVFYLDFDAARMRLSRRYGPPAAQATARPARKGFDE